MKYDKRSPEAYLEQPYSRLIVPDKENGTYTAQILEFPGCIAEGNTIQEAHERLEETALCWIQAALDLGQEIPPPASVCDYGGKVALRLPKSLHRQAALLAERDGTSLNQFIVMAVSEAVGAGKLYAQMSERLEYRLLQTAVNPPVPTATAYYQTQRTAGTWGTLLEPVGSSRRARAN